MEKWNPHNGLVWSYYLKVSESEVTAQYWTHYVMLLLITPALLTQKKTDTGHNSYIAA